jgi:hypothetical protein
MFVKSWDGLLWVHLLWYVYFLIEALIDVCQIMELMLEIKRRNCFKDGSKAKLKCVVLRLRMDFFGFGFGVDRLHFGGEIILC